MIKFSKQNQNCLDNFESHFRAASDMMTKTVGKITGSLEKDNGRVDGYREGLAGSAGRVTDDPDTLARLVAHLRSYRAIVAKLESIEAAFEAQTQRAVYVCRKLRDSLYKWEDAWFPFVEKAPKGSKDLACGKNEALRLSLDRVQGMKKALLRSHA